jgi:uncharacterized membrane protein
MFGITDLFGPDGVGYLLRFAHMLAGVTWVGLLYYFNVVQAEYLREADPAARVDVFCKLVPRALRWFRGGALLTLLTGAGLLGILGAGISLDIATGATLAFLMFVNVFLVISPSQQVVIASNRQVQGGGAPLPEAAAAAAKASLASRTNLMFSVPMLFFMGSSAHFTLGPLRAASAVDVAVLVAVIGALQFNAIFGRAGPLASVPGAVACGFGLWALLYVPFSLF